MENRAGNIPITPVPGINYKEIYVYCDEPADVRLFTELQSASRHIRNIPQRNITVYPGYSALRGDEAVLLELVREDRPDFVMTYRGRPFLVLEVTEHGYTGDNPLQRFTRFAIAAEQQVPFVYFTPFARTRDDELDETDDPSSLSKRRVNTNMFLGMLRLAEIFRVPSLACEWAVAANGKPVKLGPSPSPDLVRSVFGKLVNVLDLFTAELIEKAANKADISGHPRIRALQDEVRVLTESPNVRTSAVKLELPGTRLIELACDPRLLLHHVSREAYFFADKPERLLGLLCVEESQIESIELPGGSVVAATNPRRQLAAVFEHEKFQRQGNLYYTGYKWRSDPHCGVLVNVDYVSCRPNNSPTPAGRNRALVLFYPRVALRATSRSHVTVLRELEGLLRPGGKLYRLFQARYGGEDPDERRRGFVGIKNPTGIWSDGTKQARIFRKYCDLIVLSDAILLGNHWKTTT